MGLCGCGVLWDWGHRAGLKRDVEKLLEGQGLSGEVRGCAMEGMTRAGACLWEAQSREVDALVNGLAMAEKAPQDDGERWRGLSRCRRLAWNARNRVYGAFAGAPALRLSSADSFESFLVFVPDEGGPVCLQAAYLKP
jgi:hypothetical protein